MHPRGPCMRMIGLIAATIPLVSVVADPGAIGKYVYPDGRVVYSDKPVPGAKLEQEIKVETTKAGQPPTASASRKSSEGPAAEGPRSVPSEDDEELGPTIAEARDGACHLWVQGEGEVFAVSVEGLVPGESIEVTSTSDGETIARTKRVREDGTYGTVLFPAVAGESSGWVTFSVTGSRCQLSATFPWHL